MFGLSSGVLLENIEFTSQFCFWSKSKYFALKSSICSKFKEQTFVLRQDNYDKNVIKYLKAYKEANGEIDD